MRHWPHQRCLKGSCGEERGLREFAANSLGLDADWIPDLSHRDLAAVPNLLLPLAEVTIMHSTLSKAPQSLQCPHIPHITYTYPKTMPGGPSSDCS